MVHDRKDDVRCGGVAKNVLLIFIVKTCTTCVVRMQFAREECSSRLFQAVDDVL